MEPTEKKRAAATEAPEPSPEQVQQILGQAILTALVGLIVLGLCYFYFIWRQNSELTTSLLDMNSQSKNAQQFTDYYRSFVNDLASYSQQHPDVLQMLVRSGVEVPREQKQRPSSLMDAPPLPAPPSQ